MSSQILSKPLPYLALIIAHLIWGANFVVAKIVLEEFPPMTLAFLRFSIACLLLVPFFLAERKKIKIQIIDLPKLVSIGVLMVTLNITFFFEGLTRTTAINASILTLIIPIVSVLAGWIFLREKIYLINLFGVILALIGAIVIIGLPQIILGNFTSTELIGNFLIILASLSWVAGATISRQMLNKYPSLIVTSIAFLVGTITFIPPAVNEYLQNPGWTDLVTPLGILGLTYMTLLSSVSAYFLFEWGLAKLGVIKADLFQYIEPFVAAVLAIAILGETLSIYFIIGGLLISVGVFLGTLYKEFHHRHKSHRH